MSDETKKISVAGLFSRTKKELADIASKLGLPISENDMRQDLITTIAEAIRERSGTGTRAIRAGKKVARRVAATAGKARRRRKARRKKVGKEGGIDVAVLGAVQRTAHMAERVFGALVETVQHPAPEDMGDVPVPKAAPEAVPSGVTLSEKVVHGTGEAESAKFSISETPMAQPRVFDERLGDLPPGYGSDAFFMIARDPYWLFIYWDPSGDKSQEMAGDSGDGKFTILVHDVTDIVFDGFNAHRTLEFSVPGGSNNWYVFVNAPCRDFIARLGRMTESGFVPGFVSRKVRTPPDDFSSDIAGDFVTIPMEVPLEVIRQLVAGLKDPNEIAYALRRLQSSGAQLPFDYPSVLEMSGAYDVSGGQIAGRRLAGSEELLLRTKEESSSSVSSGGTVPPSTGE